ncbi:hypothetical protein EDD15DRAFT_2361209 [Pisolithus albus]|nr:hypothetical protein EDD15DRAFT_2361209 [Pisolithus albus]
MSLFSSDFTPHLPACPTLARIHQHCLAPSPLPTTSTTRQLHSWEVPRPTLWQEVTFAFQTEPWIASKVAFLALITLTVVIFGAYVITPILHPLSPPYPYSCIILCTSDICPYPWSTLVLPTSHTNWSSQPQTAGPLPVSAPTDPTLALSAVLRHLVAHTGL